MHTAAGTCLTALGRVVFVFIATAQPLAAAIEVPFNGQDGALAITATTAIGLENPAVVADAPWDAATPGIAADDSTVWAVFHCTSVNIAAGVVEYGQQYQYGDHLVFPQRFSEKFCRKQMSITHNDT